MKQIRCDQCSCTKLEHLAANDGMSAEDVYQALFTKINGPGGIFERALRERFAVEHPAIQTAMMQHVVRPMLEVLAKKHEGGLTDPRNKRASIFAAKALEATADILLPRI